MIKRTLGKKHGKKADNKGVHGDFLATVFITLGDLFFSPCFVNFFCF